MEVVWGAKVETLHYLLNHVIECSETSKLKRWEDVWKAHSHITELCLSQSSKEFKQFQI